MSITSKISALPPFNGDTFWTDETAEHIQVAQTSFTQCRDDFFALLDLCEHSIRTGGKILFFGNGGSAADAQHLATELSVRYIKDRAPIAALALTTDSSALTAIGNDMGFEQLFARQISAIGKAGDVAIGITTSGQSANVIAGLKAAQQGGLKAAALTGKDGGKLKDMTLDACLIVPSATTARIQEMHITFGQMLCGALERKLGLA
jgi:D-sedoheptulose 7-phosphate isomerase